MALLLVDLDKYIGTAQAWRASCDELLPDIDVRIWPQIGDLSDIEYLSLHATRFRQSSAIAQSEGDVQPFGRG